MTARILETAVRIFPRFLPAIYWMEKIRICMYVCVGVYNIYRICYTFVGFTFKAPVFFHEKSNFLRILKKNHDSANDKTTSCAFR